MGSEGRQNCATMRIKSTSAYKVCEFINYTTEVVSLLHVSITYCGHLQRDVFSKDISQRTLTVHGTVQPSDTTPHYLDGDTIYTAHEHPSLTQFSTNNFTSILFFHIYLTLIHKNLIFYICKLVLMFFAIHPSKNTSVRMATVRGRNM
jgi:hypothetical protein